MLFTLPQQRLGDVRRAQARGQVPVEALDGDSHKVVASGFLEVIDNQIDQSTGTIRLKASFPNPDRTLWPGQFVNVRVKVDTLEGVIALPTAAVQRGPAGTFVWIVGAQGKATVRPVKTGLATETQTVITEGISVGEQAVTTGFARISEGARLIVRDAPAAAPAVFARPRRTRRGRRGGRGGRRRSEQQPSAAATTGSGTQNSSGGAAPTRESRQ